jgi:diguanylate cyclase (GGDEF)-like protein/PAS domain S-box-containing protein
MSTSAPAGPEKERLLRHEHYFKSLLADEAEPIFVLDRDGVIRFVSAAAASIAGSDSGCMLKKSMAGFIHSEDTDRFRELLQRSMENPLATPPIECRIGSPLQGWTELEGRMSNFLGDPVVNGVLLQLRDSSERKQLERRRQEREYRDSVTGLANRELIFYRIHHALLQLCSRPGRGYYFLLFVDIDRFRLVNESLGIDTGDDLLRMAAGRIKSHIRKTDTVARFGRDEFLIMMDDVDSEQAALRVAEAIQQDMLRPFWVKGHELVLSASIGIAALSRFHNDAGDAVRDAEVAMYRAKSMGGCCYQTFQRDMHHNALSSMTLETDLRKAVKERQFELYYQPVVHLKSRRPVGAEALIRWRHPKKGIIPPGRFIPLAEETGLIVPIGTWVIEEACRQVRSVLSDAAWHGPFTLCINISARQFLQPDLHTCVQQAVENSGLEAVRLKLEITESVMMNDMDVVHAAFKRIRALGVEMAIDDFGTGYCSLSYLHQFPFDTLKIDRSFIQKIGDRKDKHTRILQAIVSLARHLEMNVVAEGIESERQHRVLRRLDCPFGQGYHYAKPLRRNALEAFLSAGATHERHYSL